MRVLGIDQSYTSTGLVLYVDGVLTDARLISSDSADDIFDRAWHVTSQVAEYAAKMNVDVVYMEGLAFSKFGNATRDLAGLQFVLYTKLNHIDGLPVHTVAPSELKRFATAKGSADKKAMIAAVPDDDLATLKSKFARINAKQLTDIVDAYWLARVGVTRVTCTTD